MGRTYKNKGAVITDLKALLSATQLAFVIDYQGLTVADITDLRGRLRSTGSVCKVTKNTLMRIAVEEDETWKPMIEFLKGSSAFVFVKDDVGGAVRAYQSFQKDTQKTEFRGGVMQGQALDESQVKVIANLPSKEELMGQLAGAINSLATKLAVGIKEVPSSVGRGISEVPSSLGRVIGAIAQKNGDDVA